MGITDIQRQKKNRRRVSIYIDGRYAFSLDYDTFLDSGLHIGDEVPEDMRERLAEKDSFAKARDYAYSLLSYRDRTERELKARVRDKGYGPEVAGRVARLLREQGLLDDAAFARKWVEDAQSSRPMGRMRAEHELKRRMVPDGVIRDVCDRAFGDGVELELARGAAMKRLESLKGYPGETVAERLERFLRGRGFDFEVIRKIMKSLPRGEEGGGGGGD